MDFTRLTSSQARHRHRAGSRWRRSAVTAVLAVAALTLVAAAPAGADSGHRRAENEYQQTNLVSDVPGAAQQTDPNLVNAWGMASGPSTPVWVSAADKGVATIYKGAVGGSPLTIQPLVVTIPGGSPTGQVFNPTGGFVITNGTDSAPAAFLFASEAGQITGWSPTVPPSTMAQPAVTTPDAIYKGLTMANTSGGSFLYAANFHAGTVDVFDSTFTPVHMPGAFVDHKLPHGYAPFGIQEINGSIYVTYAKQDANAEDDVKGQGHGFVDVYTPDGSLVRRLIRHGALNSPWGLAMAPSDFGRFGGALLVGNFGDGRVDAYDAHNGHFLGALRDEHHHKISIDGLWGLRFGNGVTGDANTLLFTAGPDDESHGLFGTLTAEH